MGTPQDDRLAGRDGDIWRGYCSGKTQEALAREFGISQSRISQIINEVRASIPEVDKAQAFQRELDFLDVLRVQAIEIANMPAAPVTAGKDGDVVLDPETGAVVRDYGGKLAAMDRAVKMHERYAKLLGLEAPTKVDLSMQEQNQQAAQAAAADAMARLHGGE
jgi:hypothetical protein